MMIIPILQVKYSAEVLRSYNQLVAQVSLSVSSLPPSPVLPLYTNPLTL